MDRFQFKIVSGGQTGVDQGGLQAARALGLDWGGWVPKGWRTENGPLSAVYREKMQEHCSSNYLGRTLKNVVDSHATLIILNTLPLTGGTKKTKEFALNVRRSHFVVSLEEENGVERVQEWLKSFFAAESSPHPLVLNVAGPRESKVSGIQKRTKKFLIDVFAGLGISSVTEDA